MATCACAVSCRSKVNTALSAVAAICESYLHTDAAADKVIGTLTKERMFFHNIKYRSFDKTKKMAQTFVTPILQSYLNRSNDRYKNNFSRIGLIKIKIKKD